MARSLTMRRRLGRSRGFTLVEILVVLLIVLLLSVAVAVAVPGALQDQRANEAARVIQAYFEQAHDAAVRANAPRGVRLIPDFEFPGPTFGKPLAYSRMLMLEPAPDYSEGSATIYAGLNPVSTLPYLVLWPDPYTAPALYPTAPGSLPPIGLGSDPRLQVYQRTFEIVTINGNPVDLPLSPTSWYWNVKQGDKIQFGGSGRTYTIAGPNLAGNAANPERFVNYGMTTQAGFETFPAWTAGGVLPFTDPNMALPFNAGAEVLYLVNGVDDNKNGWIDESFDGIDNDGDGVIDPGFNGLDDNGDGVVDDPYELLWSKFGYTGGEYEQETWQGPAAFTSGNQQQYVIKRRPVPVQTGNQEVSLPAGTVIDATTFNLTAERSRLPIDPYTGYVDIMIGTSGEVVSMGASASYAPQLPPPLPPFYHFWVADRSDVHLPVPNPGFPTARNLLPMPAGTANYASTIYLKGGRRLVTIFPKTGLIVTNALENFSTFDLNVPYYEAQLGARDIK